MTKPVSIFVKVPPGIGKKQNHEPPPDPTAVVSLTLAPASLPLVVGMTGHASVTARNALGDVIATPTDIAVITSNALQATASYVVSELVIQALAAGTPTIRVTGGGVTSNTLTLTITAPVVVRVPTSASASASSLTPIQNTPVTIHWQLLDQFDAPLPLAGEVVTWSKTGAGGAFASPTTVTDASGVAEVQFTVANDPAINHVVTGTRGLIAASTGIIDVRVTPDVPVPGGASPLDGGWVDVYAKRTGAVPANADTDPDIYNMLMGTIPIPVSGAFGAAVGGVRSLVAPLQGIAYWGENELDTPMVPDYVRVRNHNNSVRAQALVGVGAGKVSVTTTHWQDGQRLTLDSLDIIE